MSRDWDKLKRLDRATRPSSIDSFVPKFKHKSKKSNGVNLYGPYHEPKSTPTYYRSVTITGDNLVMRARFKIAKGKWTCIKADPAIDWFLRIRHPEQIENWLKTTHFQRVWGPKEHLRQPSTSCAAESHNKHPSPAEDYTPKQASHRSAVNTGTMSNPITTGAKEGVKPNPPSPSSGAQWFDHTSALNCVGRPT